MTLNIKIAQGFLAFSLLYATQPALSFNKQTEVETMKNANTLAVIMDSVEVGYLNLVVKGLEEGRYKHRLHGDQPFWLLEADQKTIVYYQGQPSYKGRSADLLIDDSGQRFGAMGIRAIQNSKNQWLTLNFGGAQYKAYCHVIQPYAACSLMLK